MDARSLQRLQTALFLEQQSTQRVLHPLSGKGRSTRRLGREIDLDRRDGVKRAIPESTTRRCRGIEILIQWGRYLTWRDGGRESTLQPSSIPAGDTPAGSTTSLDPVGAGVEKSTPIRLLSDHQQDGNVYGNQRAVNLLSDLDFLVKVGRAAREK